MGVGAVGGGVGTAELLDMEYQSRKSTNPS